MKFYKETVSEEMLSLLNELMSINELAAYRLVGGTSLSLQFGHRTSIDIDLFAGGAAETDGLPKILSNHFPSFQLLSKNKNGLMGLINGIKVDMVDWKVPFAEEAVVIENLRLASAADIFAYKCDALLERKTEKDFVDIAMIASQYELGKLFEVLRKRYFYITASSVAAMLLKSELITRDHSIKYFEPFSFDYFVKSLTTTLNTYELTLKHQKKSELETRAKKIQSLIEQKRKKQ
ncbi:MAG: nucleotidyl transferase AbiEii/AbiGii toxin family protein [Cyclobacteriaceae bacterium]|nr:nucleotidyl transferase AbiEii/AbiGii toxin family protein [Cyclobacteriaceae bacterium]